MSSASYRIQQALFLNWQNKVAVASQYHLPIEYVSKDMDLDSPISMCLPSKLGGGLCALALAEYIIDQQNSLLHKCREIIRPQPS